jgi:hypothetical protein
MRAGAGMQTIEAQTAGGHERRIAPILNEIFIQFSSRNDDFDRFYSFYCA